MTDGHQPHEPGLDAIAAFNRDRWEALVAADVPYARPLLDLDTVGARATVDPYGLVLDVWLLTDAERARQPWPRTPAEAASWRFDAAAQAWSRP